MELDCAVYAQQFDRDLNYMLNLRDCDHKRFQEMDALQMEKYIMKCRQEDPVTPTEALARDRCVLCCRVSQKPPLYSVRLHSQSDVEKAEYIRNCRLEFKKALFCRTNLEQTQWFRDMEYVSTYKEQHAQNWSDVHDSWFRPFIKQQRGRNPDTLHHVPILITSHLTFNHALQMFDLYVLRQACSIPPTN